MRPDEPSDPPLQRITVAGHDYAFADEGAGPVLLLLHGVPGTHRDFRWLAPSLPGLRVVRPDLPGFGDTAGFAPAYHEAIAKTALALVDALHIERFAVVGHSMGGVFATALAVMAPERVTALGLLSSVGLRRHRGLRRNQKTLRRIAGVVASPLGARVLAPLLRRGFARSGFGTRHGDDTLVRSIQLASGVSFGDHAANVRRLRCPTLVAWTADDPLLEADIAEQLAAACPSGPRLSFADGGHNPQKAHAVEIGAALTDLVRSI